MQSTATPLQVTAQGDREILITREFAAPRRLVFAAWTKPELVKRWLTGPSPWVMAVCEIDLRVGGRYRYVSHNPATHADMGMGGEYREVAAPERLVATEKFDDPWYPGEAVGTIVFTEEGGRTTLRQTMVYESKATRDAVLQSPMETGVAQSFDNLARLLAENA